jgi:hypothetical protein
MAQASVAETAAELGEVLSATMLALGAPSEALATSEALVSLSTAAASLSEALALLETVRGGLWQLVERARLCATVDGALIGVVFRPLPVLWGEVEYRSGSAELAGVVLLPAPTLSGTLGCLLSGMLIETSTQGVVDVDDRSCYP